MNWKPVTNNYYWYLKRNNLGRAINWVNDRSKQNIKCSSLITTNTDDRSQSWSVPIIPMGDGYSDDFEVWNLKEDGWWHHVDNGKPDNLHLHYFVDSIPEWDNVLRSWGFNKFSKSPKYLEYLENKKPVFDPTKNLWMYKGKTYPLGSEEEMWKGGSVHSYKYNKRRSKKRKATKRKNFKRKATKRKNSKRKVTRRKNTRRRRR